MCVRECVRACVRACVCVVGGGAVWMFDLMVAIDTEGDKIGKAQ